MTNMKWHIKQNKKGTKCVITCDTGVMFLNTKVTYLNKDSKLFLNAEEAYLLVSCNSWRRKKPLKKCKCDPYKNECCDICTGYAEAKRKNKLKDKG